MANENWDAIVVGAGQAGPALAVRLARAGNRTALIEQGRIGGTCVNTGCTPTKALVASARVAHLARRAAEFGVRLDAPVAIDFARVRARMNEVVDQSYRGLGDWLDQTGALSRISAHARFTSPDTITAGDRVLSAPRIFLNVGCRPVVPDWSLESSIPSLTNEALLALQELPAHLAIVGGGSIGLEFAQIFRRLGCDVTVLEQAPALLSREDPEAAAEIRAALEADGIRFELGASCFRLEQGEANDRIAVTFARGGAHQRIAATHVLVAVGRRPNTDDLGLEHAGIHCDARGYIPVDGQLRTGVPGIWALGDVNGRGAFTHTSWNDYEVVAANVLDGHDLSIDGRIAPYALYVDPPLARIGDSEAQARARGVPLLVGFLPMKDVARARERSETRGFMKVLVDGGSMQLLGATLVCIDADEVIHSLLDVMTAKIDVRTIAASVPIHPTISELIPTLLQRLQPL
jgi:pyruvate/2-oxoglutarate dehydrogenase complex dihydrolipoamide dehydrogenase (E3) component